MNECYDDVLTWLAELPLYPTNTVWCIGEPAGDEYDIEKMQARSRFLRSMWRPTCGRHLKDPATMDLFLVSWRSLRHAITTTDRIRCAQCEIETRARITYQPPRKVVW
jgi:hypothetical protein